MPRFNITKAFGSISQPRLSAEYVRINVCMLYMCIYICKRNLYVLFDPFLCLLYPLLIALETWIQEDQTLGILALRRNL